MTALAGALGRPICVISLSSKGMSDESLRGLLNSAEPRCVLLLEVGSRKFARAACNSSHVHAGLPRGLLHSAAPRCVLLLEVDAGSMCLLLALLAGVCGTASYGGRPIPLGRSTLLPVVLGCQHADAAGLAMWNPSITCSCHKAVHSACAS